MTIPALKIQDIASIIGTSAHTVYKAIRDNKLDIVKSGNKKLLPPATVKKILASRGYAFEGAAKPKVINILGMKGGIGKTSIATAIAEGASRLGFKVLAIDLDMQGNLSQSFNKKDNNQPTLINVIRGELSAKDIVVNVHDFLDIIPSGLNNARMELELSHGQIDTPSYFESLLSEIYADYNLIIIDCPPSINRITSCAACYADLNIIPINADIDSFEGVVMSVAEIKYLEKAFEKRDLNLKYRIIFNKYDAREKSSLQIMGRIGSREDLSAHLMPVVIRTDTAFKNSKINREHIYDVKRSNGREDLLRLISELTGIEAFFNQNNKKRLSAKDANLV